MSDNLKKESYLNMFKKKITNPNILIFLFFLLISTILWLLIVINKEYTTTIQVPIKYVNVPGKYDLPTEDQEFLQVTIQGEGYSLLQEKIEGVKLPLVINFEEQKKSFNLKTNLNSNYSYIVVNELIKLLSTRYNENIKIISVKPDTLYFNMANNLLSKKVPVKSEIKYTIHSDFIRVGNDLLKPDSVVVTGTKDLVDSIKFVSTNYEDIGEIRENNSKAVSLSHISNIRLSTSIVMFTVPIERFTEKTVEVKIKPYNFSDSLSYMLLPDKVFVSYKVPISLDDKIDSSNFVVSADYNLRKKDNIKVDVMSLNTNIQLTKYSPAIIRFIIEKKNQ